MSNKTGLKDNGSMKAAVQCASSARTAPANKRVSPPPGPKPEPVRTNGVPSLPDRGTSR